MATFLHTLVNFSPEMYGLLSDLCIFLVVSRDAIPVIYWSLVVMT